MPLQGSCLCRAVRYEADRLASPIVHCHCTTCRKAQASAYASTARVMRESFRWLAGEARLSRYESSEGKFRYFCSICGTHVLADRPAQPHLILRVATLDDDPGARPESHIWTSHDVPWLTDAPAAPDAPGTPHYAEWSPPRP